MDAARAVAQIGVARRHLPQAYNRGSGRPEAGAGRPCPGGELIMRNTLAIARREAGSYFNSPIAYIFIPVFLILVSAFFFPPLFLNNQAEVRDLFGPPTTFLL